VLSRLLRRRKSQVDKVVQVELSELGRVASATHAGVIPQLLRNTQVVSAAVMLCSFATDALVAYSSAASSALHGSTGCWNAPMIPLAGGRFVIRTRNTGL